MIEGIVWEQKNGEWVKTENWPVGRRRAKIKIDTQDAFGDYTLAEATAVIDEALTKGWTKDHFKYTIVPGRETTLEEKKKFAELTKRKKIERGELEPVESYVSKEE